MINSLKLDSVTFAPQNVLTNICSEDPHHYGFNGKMKDNEWAGVGNHMDYGFRRQDTRTGRFISVDPLTKKYPMLTPYQFASNSPIAGIDLDGLEHYYAADGKLLGKYGSSKVVRVVNNSDANTFKATLGHKNVSVGQLNRLSHRASTSTNGAAGAWGKTYNPKSIQLNRELGSDIYTLKIESKTYYNYAEPNLGGGADVTCTPAPNGTKTVADIHAHAAYDPALGYGNEIFSPDDKADNTGKGTIGYVVTPDGSLKKYDPKTNTSTTLRTDMPNDPNDPNVKKPDDPNAKKPNDPNAKKPDEKK